MVIRILLLLVGLLGVAALILLGLRQIDDSRLNAAIMSLESPPTSERFDERVVSTLPEPARRYLLHAIRPRARIASIVWLEMGGSIRPSRDDPWAALRAEESLAAEGFVRRASIERSLGVVGYDAYVRGNGRETWSLLGWIPVGRGSGEDLTRSLRTRLALDLIWLPTALLPRPGVRWEGVDEETAKVSITIDGDEIELVLQVAPDGALRGVRTTRWGDGGSNGKWFREIPFGVDVVEEATFGGYTIPVRVRAGWDLDSDRPGEIFRPELREALFR